MATLRQINAERKNYLRQILQSVTQTNTPLEQTRRMLRSMIKRKKKFIEYVDLAEVQKGISEIAKSVNSTISLASKGFIQ